MNTRILLRDLCVGDIFRVISPRTETTKSGNTVENNGVYVKEGNSHCTDLLHRKDAILPLGARVSVIRGVCNE